MKLLRLLISLLFVIVLVTFVIFQFMQLGVDKTIPQITIDNDVIEVSLDVTNEYLLQGVTAYDQKDGDLTDKVIVESISRFIEPGVSVVKYAVCDSDNHAAYATRKILYVNYVPPRFKLKDSLVFNISQNINIRNILGAVDTIDGDISNKVIITANEYSANIPGVYYISAKVTNSKGDMILQQFPIYIEERSLAAPQLVLKEHISYLKVGDNFDIYNNILSALSSDGENLVSQIYFDTNLDLSTPGMYEIHYRVADTQGRIGHEITIIIVE